MSATVPYQLMARERIQPSPLNPRKHFDQAKLEELAGSMGNDVGIVEPLVVRPRPDLNCYELVAGERRWRAAAIAGLAEVPVVVKELSDAQVLEIMVIENNQREDITPLEEAAGFKQLLGLGKFDADALSERLGRSRKYVYDRIKLLELIPLGQELLATGRITAGHGILLARLKAKDQERALAPSSDAVFEDEHERLDPGAHGDRVMRFARSRQKKADPYVGLKARSVRELETWIAAHVRFDVAHMARQAPLEFGEVGAAVARALAAPGRGKKVVAITFDYRTPDATRDPSERTYGSNSWKPADGTDGAQACAHSVLGVVAGGPGYGRALEVCVARDRCEVHWKAEVADRRKREKAKATGGSSKATVQQVKQREEADRRKHQAEQEQEKAQQKAWDKARPQLLEACATKVQGLKLEALVGILIERYDQAPYARALELLGGGTKAATPEMALRALALKHFVNEVAGNYRYAREDFARQAKKDLGVDVPAILKQVQTSAPPAAGEAGRGKKAAKAKARKAA